MDQGTGSSTASEMIRAAMLEMKEMRATMIGLAKREKAKHAAGGTHAQRILGEWAEQVGAWEKLMRVMQEENDLQEKITNDYCEHLGEPSRDAPVYSVSAEVSPTLEWEARPPAENEGKEMELKPRWLAKHGWMKQLHEKMNKGGKSKEKEQKRSKRPNENPAKRKSMQKAVEKNHKVLPWKRESDKDQEDKITEFDEDSGKGNVSASQMRETEGRAFPGSELFQRQP